VLCKVERHIHADKSSMIDDDTECEPQNLYSATLHRSFNDIRW
jgi:hypothetical protein